MPKNVTFLLALYQFFYLLQVLGMVKPRKMDTWLLRPPILVGERIVWLGSGSGLPQCGIVRWIGKLPEMGSDWTIGVELVGIFIIYALFNCCE